MKFAGLSTLLGLASLANLAAARTDLEGCVSSTVVIGYGASLLWYVPDTGEICSFLDCGGGRAPPKTNVPGCGGYHGTATVTPDYIEGWGPNGKQAASTTTILSTSAALEASTTAEAQTTTTQASETASATTFNAASGLSAKGAGVMAVVAAMVGAIGL
ncbi:hypothetical protein N7535_007053 [Penicillium sp. DV-2018c]|nr:hypothetical protein N7535_007053 [Penicillium sp. DV-2018c]